MRKIAGLLIAFSMVAVNSQHVSAEPGWSPVIIATGEYRSHIESLPIEMRPYRPLHFYGNTVRRNHYRGNPLPMPQINSRSNSNRSVVREPMNRRAF